MKNKEVYSEEIEAITKTGKLSIKHNLPKVCGEENSCLDCIRRDLNKSKCIDKPLLDWLESEYIEEVDWSKVPVDAKVLVSGDGIIYSERHFAGYKDGKVRVFPSGETDWTHGTNLLRTETYEYTKLAEPLTEKTKSAMELLAESYYADGCKEIKDDVFKDMLNSCPKDHGYVNVVKCDVGENDAKLADCYKCWTLPQPDKMEG